MLTATPPTVIGSALSGTVHGGQQPVAGARVYLYAAGTGGNGSSSRSMLSAPGYVLSAADGTFTITGRYTCQPGDLVYVLALGGNPGLAAGTQNAALALETGVGSCADLLSTTQIAVNEVTTVATVYALNGFESGAGYVGSTGTAAGTRGLVNAFSMIPNLVDTATGATRTTPASGAGAVPQAELNSLANTIAACVNSDGTGTPCTALFDATTARLFPPTETVTSLVNLANSPGKNVATLFNLSTANAPFQPALKTAPNDWAVAVQLSGLGAFEASGVALDSQGNAWLPSFNEAGSLVRQSANDLGGGIFKMSPNGTQLSPLGGFQGAGATASKGVAVDPSDNVWVVNLRQSSTGTTGSVSEMNNAGVPLSGATGYAGGGLTLPRNIAIDGSGFAWVTDSSRGVVKLDASGNDVSGNATFSHGGSFVGQAAIDPQGHFWAANNGADSVAELASDGSVLAYQYGTDASATGAQALAIDHAGNVWVAGANMLTELNSSGTAISPAGGFTGGGLGTGTAQNLPLAVAIDGRGFAYAVSSANGNASRVNLAAFDYNGTAISPSTGFRSSYLTVPLGVAVDGSGNVWVADRAVGAVVFLGLANPVVTPLSAGIKNGTLGTTP